MPQVDAKIKVGMELISDSLETEAKNKAKKAGKAVQNELNNSTKKLTFGQSVKGQFQKIKKGIEAIGVSGDKLGKLGEFFAGGGWLAAAAAGIAVLAKSIHTLWDQMTLTNQEKILKTEKFQKIAKDKLNTELEQSKTADGYSERLRELNKQQNLSLNQKAEIITIVRALNRTYGDLGFRLDLVTGKVLNLDEALGNLNGVKTERKIGAAKNSLKQLELLANLGAVQFLDKFFAGGGFFISAKNKAKNVSYFGNDADFEKEIAKGLNVKFNTKDNGVGVDGGKLDLGNFKLSEEEKKLRQAWNSGIEGKIKFLQALLKKSTTKEEIESISKLIEKLRELNRVQTELYWLRETGFKSQEEWLEFIKRENQELERLKANLENQAKMMLQQRTKKEQQNFLSGLSGTDQKMMYLSLIKDGDLLELKKMEEAVEKIKYTIDQLRKWKVNPTQEIKQLYKQLNDAEFKVLVQKNGIKDIEDEIFRLKKMQFEQDLKKLKNDGERIKKLKELLFEEQDKEIKANLKGDSKGAKEAKLMQLELEERIQKLKDRSKNFYAAENSAMDFQLKLQNLKLQGKFKEIQLLQLQKKLEDQGLIQDKKKINELLKKQQQFNRKNVDLSLRNQAENMYAQFFQDDRQFQLQKRIRDLEQANGVSLTDSQKKDVETLFDLEEKLKNISKFKLNLSGMDIKTNDLTARGGFQTGAVLPDIVSINKSIRDYSAKTSQTINEIKNILKNGWKF